MQTVEMLLLQLFLISAIQICFGAEIGSLDDIRDQIFNRLHRQATSEAPQIQEENLDILNGSAFGNHGNGNGQPQPQPQPQPQQQPQSTPVDTTLPSPGGSDDLNCTCVPYYLCSSNETIIEDGSSLIDKRIRRQLFGPCDNHLDVCCNAATNNPDIPYTPKPVPVPRISSCGQRNFEGIGFHITGADDNESQYGEFPWMVFILRAERVEDGTTPNVYQCGGSLIHPQVVMTAAHCVAWKDPKNLKARAGEWDIQTKNELYPHQDRNVQEIIVHENYYASALFNDIALLIMESPFDIAENVALICLPDEGEIMDGRQCAASGWGKEVFGKEERYQMIMKKVELPVVSRKTCVEALRKTRLGQYFKLHDSFICAGGEPGKDTCEGDGGSPLVCPSRDNPNIYRQAGIVAWGIGCGTATPGVYVNVPFLRGWITSKLSAYNFELK